MEETLETALANGCAEVIWEASAGRVINMIQVVCFDYPGCCEDITHFWIAGQFQAASVRSLVTSCATRRTIPVPPTPPSGDPGARRDDNYSNVAVGESRQTSCFRFV